MSEGPYYHRIPLEYSLYLGGLRWSASGDAVEYEDGTTFALVPEIGQFLEGLTSDRRLLHFMFVLHLLHLLGKGRIDLQREVLSDIVQYPLAFCAAGCPPEDSQRRELLRQAFQEAGRPLRNAGAFFAALCREISPIFDPFVFHPHEWMVQSSILWFHRVPPHKEWPPLDPAAFEDFVLAKLAGYTPEELRHWLRHGRGPVKTDADRLAKEIIVPKPRSLTEVLADLTKRERLAGAVPYVDRLVSALALPPRRLARQELPLGGYSDVATRGQPEQILPSQFALDELEFVRRFASNELLFFRREEPQTQTKEELVLLLDQGVRCWGDVRLVLTAAVFALARRVARSTIAVRLAATSAAGKLLDCRADDATALGELLEVSDLSAHPALALERVLELPVDGPRDVVLLTHPRSLHEADVQAGARRVGGDCRLFAVTVDGHGQAELSELRHGVPVPRTRFRITWETPPPVRPVPQPDAAPSAFSWTGNVEPIGFPFRFGVNGPLGPFAFDQSSEWLLVSGPQGMLHIDRTDGQRSEVLPRGFLHGIVLTQVETILGVADGFVVCGMIQDEMVAFHYHLAHRTCTARIIGVPALGPGHRQWYYFPEHHAVVMKEPESMFGVDLRTGERGYHKPGIQAGTAPALQACAEAEKYPVPPPGVAVRDRDFPKGAGHSPAIFLDEGLGLICFDSSERGQVAFTPLADGKPILAGSQLVSGQACGNTMALCSRFFKPDQWLLLFLRIPHEMVLGSIPLAIDSPLPIPPHRCYALSPDGSKLARLSSPTRAMIHDLTGTGRGTWVTPRGKYHSQVNLECGEHWLAVHVGNFAHMLDWTDGVLIHSHTTTEGKAFIGRKRGSEAGNYRHERAASYNRGVPHLSYDRQRFLGGANPVLPGLWIAVDAYGQVIVLNQKQELVCMFFVFRNHLAGWMPDGTRYGPASLTGGPETDHAAKRIGQTLLAAEMLGERHVVIKTGSVPSE